MESCVKKNLSGVEPVKYPSLLNLLFDLCLKVLADMIKIIFHQGSICQVLLQRHSII